MASSYEVIDLISGNLADCYDDVDQALTILAKVLHDHGPAELMEYGLLEVRANGELGESWGDEALLEKVEAFARASKTLSPST